MEDIIAAITIESRVDTEGVIDPKDDQLYRDPVLCTGYYNYYFSYGRHFRPRRVYEIGVRSGYTGYFILLGAAGAVEQFRGIDSEVYKRDSVALATTRIGRLCKDVKIVHGNSHALVDLGGLYDLIHVDGDHSYGGKVMDLELALGALAPRGVIVVDDCWPKGPKAEVMRATKEFVDKKGLAWRWLQPLLGSSLNPVDGHILIQRREAST